MTSNSRMHQGTVPVSMRSLAALFFSAVLLCGCGSGSDSGAAPAAAQSPYVYRTPTQTADGWTTGDLQQVGISSTLPSQLIDRIRRREPGFDLIDSVLIARNGVLVFDELTRTSLEAGDEQIGNRDLNLHALNSVTKSFTSTAVGIAIDQGYLPNVDLTVHDYYSDKIPIQNFTTDKASIRLRDWLTMRAGYSWNEGAVSYLDASNVWRQMSASSDPVRFLLDRPMADAPGSTFTYNTGVSFLLGDLVHRATQQEFSSYLSANLLSKLNIQNFRYVSVGGQLAGGSGLFLSHRDMAKLGQLFLDGGVWNQVRVVSQDWVTLATQTHTPTRTPNTSYGFQWWKTTFSYQGRELESFYANGFGAQYVIVIPELRLVVGLTGHALTDAQASSRAQVRVVQDFVLPAIAQ